MKFIVYQDYVKSFALFLVSLKVGDHVFVLSSASKDTSFVAN